MASTGICAYCGAPISSSSQKCPNCGAANPLYVVPLRTAPVTGEAKDQSPRPASTGTCPYCGGTLRSDQKYCPGCGAENPHFVVDTPRRIVHPRTIAELKEYCAERGMPLLRMRFFIGEDREEPRAFGIYQSGDRFVVYKNKDNGNRAVRYDGPDEAYAVNEIFQKLLVECHSRGIYPDRTPGTAPQVSFPTRIAANQKKPLWKKLLKWLGIFLIWPIALLVFFAKRLKSQKANVLLVLLMFFGMGAALVTTMVHLSLLVGLPAMGIEYLQDHKGDGYYLYEGEAVYYKDGTQFYYWEAQDDWWTPDYNMRSMDEESFLGEEHADEWGFPAFDELRSGSPYSGYYRLEGGTYGYFYALTWYVYDAQEDVWLEICSLPYCPPGCRQEGAWLGWDYDPAWGVPDAKDTFAIAIQEDRHSKDGYYRFGDDLFYYCGYSYDPSDNWYAWGEYGWQSAAAPEGSYDKACLGAELDPAWGVTDARKAFVVAVQEDRHSRDGYYRFGDDLYYYYGKYYDPSYNWYSYEDGDWTSADAPQGSYDTTYEGDAWDSGWGNESFTESSTWDDLHPTYSGSSSSSYDSDSSYSSWDSGSSYDSWDSGSYDSWDSSDTDWGSDW